jgi:hypothetical protein
MAILGNHGIVERVVALAPVVHDVHRGTARQRAEQGSGGLTVHELDLAHLARRAVAANHP